MAADSDLFKPLPVGRMELKHRLAMAPLTRYRADLNHVHHEIAAEYYGQRACEPGTLLITEATFIDLLAGGYDHVPACHTPEQVAGWKRVVDEVHRKGSYIYLQMWALGRAAKAETLRRESDADVVSASDIPIKDGPVPRPMTKSEIKDYVQYYARTAKAFVEEAGGDGVEIHNANGYLPDQFLQSVSNDRTDEYGGSIENRARFPLEIAKAVTDAVGADRVGIRISPYSVFQSMRMKSTEEIRSTFSYFVKELRDRHPDLAYIHAVESRVSGGSIVEADRDENLDFIHDLWSPRPFLIAGGFDRESAHVAADQYSNTVVAFGRYFISNPDLVRRIREDIPLTDHNRDTFYLRGPEQKEGYTDYPFAEKNN